MPRERWRSRVLQGDRISSRTGGSQRDRNCFEYRPWGNPPDRGPWRTEMKRGNAGFTLVELLISAAILMILLAVLGAMFSSTRRAYETNREVTASAGQLRSAVNAIQNDLAAAGFVGSR